MNDEELKARLQASDPAASLPPAAPHEVARLLEDVMATELTTESRETGTRGRGPLTWLVAAAAAVVIAGVGFLGFHALTGDTDDGGGPVAASVTELDVPAGAGAGKCMVPNAEVLADADVAFDGTVTSIVGDRVTLDPTHWYAGEPTDRVVVTAPSEQLQRIASAVVFRAGGRYLVSARDGHVSLCGFSAPYDEGLAAVYAEAFPGLMGGPMHGLLLAAGAGSRMGMPKALVRADDGEPWLVRGVRTLVDGGCSRVTVVLGAAAEEALPLLEGSGATGIVVAEWAEGMSASLRAGLAALTVTDSEAVVVTLVDLPDVGADVVRRLLDPTPGRASLRRASYDGRVGHPVVIGRDHWVGVAEETTGDRGARGYLATHEVEVVECGDLASGRDVDSR